MSREPSGEDDGAGSDAEGGAAAIDYFDQQVRELADCAIQC